MARLKNLEKLACYMNALKNRKYTGYITFTQLADEWLRRELAGFTEKRFTQLMFEFVEAGGEIDEVVECRPEWSEHSHH